MQVCFSYCLYGPFNPKYYYGLINNIKFVQEHFPKAIIHCWMGSDVEYKYFNLDTNPMNNVILKKINITGYKIPAHRVFSIDDDNIDIVFSRDCDSMISEREIGLMNEFIASPYLLHTIRDHCGHKMIFMAGLFGIKKRILNLQLKTVKIRDLSYELFKSIDDTYILDQLVLQILFNNLRSKLLVHSTKNIFNDINFIKIDPPIDNNFCGQVIDYDLSGNPYMVHEYENYK